MRSGLALLCFAGCITPGSLELTLRLPADPELRPAGMTSISVLASAADLSVANTSPYDGGAFSAGELPYAEDVQIAVELRDEANRLVGVGRARELLDLTKAGARATIEVRRPFVYGTSGNELYAYDPTLETSAPRFQTVIPGVSMPTQVVAIDADRIVVASGNALSVFDTASHAVTGNPISIAPAMAIRDLAHVPGSSLIVVAHDVGVSIANIDSGAVQAITAPAVDQITVGNVGGQRIAWGLSSRVAPPETPLSSCAGTSLLVAVSIDDATLVAQQPIEAAVSALAAAPSGSLYATLPCLSQVAILGGDLLTDGVPLAPDPLAALPNAATMTVAGDRLWVVGTEPSKPTCRSGPCTAQSQQECPETPAANRLMYVTEDGGARLVLASIDLRDHTATTVELPAFSQTFRATDDPSGALGQVLQPLGTVPVALTVLADGAHVSVATRSRYYIESLIDQTLGQPIFPCLKSTVDEWSIRDISTGAIAQRIRTRCELVFRTDALFPGWECEEVPDNERPEPAEYVLGSLSALLGDS